MPYLLKTIPDPESLDCRILTAALELFVDRGFHNVSVHDIQKRAGVSIGSIYNYFGGKEGIAKSLYDHLLIEMNQVIDTVVRENTGMVNQCNAMVRKLFEFTETHGYIIAFVLDAKHTEFLSDTTPIYSSAPFNRLLKVITKGIERGEIEAIDPVVASTLIFGSAIRLINLRLEGSVKKPLMNYFDELMGPVWLGLGADSTIVLTSAVGT